MTVSHERKTIVAANMELTAQESGDFWPVYNDYQADSAKVVDRLVTLIRAYAQSYNYASLTDEKAKEMLKELLSVEKAKLKLRKKYGCKFNKVLPEKKVLRLYQLENKMDAVIQLPLASEIPLALQQRISSTEVLWNRQVQPAHAGQAMAIDIRIPGIKTRCLRDAALTLSRGGVGYYPRPDFVHVDVGRVRHW